MGVYLGNLDIEVLLLTVAVGVSITGSGSDGLEPVDSVSDAEECPSEPWSAGNSGDTCAR